MYDLPVVSALPDDDRDSGKRRDRASIVAIDLVDLSAKSGRSSDLAHLRSTG